MDTIKLIFLVCFSICSLQIQGQTEYAKITKNTSLKTSSSSKSKTITRLTNTDKLIYLGDCDRYYCKVEWNGKTGWVKKHLLEVSTESKTPLKTEQVKSTSSDNSMSDTTSPLESDKNTFTSNNTFSTLPYLIILLGIFLIGVLTYLSYKLYKKVQKLRIDKAESIKRLDEEKVIAIQELEKENSINIQKLEKEKAEVLTKFQKFQVKFKGVVDVEEEISKGKKEIIELRKSENELRARYHKAKEIYSQLEYESNLLKNDLEIAEFGIYEPQFDYETSAVFKLKINENRTKQKELISLDKAVLGGLGWELNGSSSKGKAMIKKQKKLMLRALNGECDNFIKSVKWNNEARMEARIIKSAALISKIGEAQGLKISDEYVKLKLLELKLTHEAELKKYEEKEIQREIRERIRDEERAIKEYEKAKNDAEKEEKLLHDAMKKAKEKMEKASAEERFLYESRLVDLKEKLKEAEEKNQRAISMAQQTKAGHVYVISNIGSFGENVFKIGMTRRLEPLDRVYELGDASVPFRFDVHAMIYSENAPELESQLHKQFDKYRINHVNRRREYFNVSLKEIEKVVRENHGEIEFVIEPEAREYRESLVIKQRLFPKKQASIKNVRTKFPSEI